MLHNLKLIERHFPNHSNAIIRTLFIALTVALVTGVGLLLLLG
jgi:hypothetical protein